MDFVNNWSRPATLAAGANTLALDLPDGSYRLTLADSPSAATRWEIIDAVVVAGTATLTRAQEGTADQSWGAGSVIYCALTAGVLAGLSASPGASRSPVVLVTASRPLTLADEGAFLRMGAEGLEMTLPAQSEVAWPDGAELSFAGWGGFTVRGAWNGEDYVSFMYGDSFENYVESGSQYAVIRLKRMSVDRWVAYGDFLAGPGLF